MPTERARIHLQVMGQNTLVEADVENGSVPPGALLPLAHALSRAGLDAARMHSMLAGKPMSCAEGCAHCCRQLVTLAPIEALAIAAIVEAMPEERREIVRARFQEALDRMVEIGVRPPDAAPGEHRLIGPDPSAPARSAMARYYEAKIPCPLLEDERCSIYEQRPTVCREHAVSSAPALCTTLNDKAEALERPLAVFRALLELGATFGSASREAIPLPAALEWARAHGETVSGAHDAEQMFHVLVQRMQAEQDGPDGPGIVPPR